MASPSYSACVIRRSFHGDNFATSAALAKVYIFMCLTIYAPTRFLSVTFCINRAIISYFTVIYCILTCIVSGLRLSTCSKE